MSLPFVIFVLFAGLTLAGAGLAAFSRDIVYAGFGLLGALAGMVGLYGLLSADFLALLQMLIYVGGILVLILFAIMLTHNTQNRKTSNPIGYPWAAGTIALLGVAALMGVLARIPTPPDNSRPPVSVQELGAMLLGDSLWVFELAGILLLVALVGAAAVARRESRETHRESHGT